MADDLAKTATQQQVADVEKDIHDRRDWTENQHRWRTLRLSDRPRRSSAYPGAPNLREPLIDDNIRDLTTSEINILWSARYVAAFIPLTEEASRFKRRADEMFDTLLRLNLRVRANLEVLFDCKNERGMSLAKVVTNSTVIPGSILPDFEPLDPVDVVVPVGTKQISAADRLCHIIRYTKREFVTEAARRGWDRSTVAEVIDRITGPDQGARETRDKAGGGGTGGRDDRSGMSRGLSGAATMQGSTDEIVVYEIYDYREPDGTVDHDSPEQRKWMTVVARDAPAKPLTETPWKWGDTSEPTGRPELDEDGLPVLDPTTGQAMPEMEKITGDDRPWPFVAFVAENRTLAYYDSRGVAELLRHAQASASNNKTAKATWMDYTARPFLIGGRPGVMSTFRWKPGSVLPDGVTFAQMPRVDPIFDYNMDQERASASRRVGAPRGSLSSLDKTKDTKTATEVAQSAMQANAYSANGVERFAESLGELWTMMWEQLSHTPPRGLVSIVGDESSAVPEELWTQKFLVVAGVSGKSANPDLQLHQLAVVAEALQQVPQALQFVIGQQYAQMVFELMDPKTASRLVADPARPGAAGAPIEQQVMQLGQAMGPLMEQSREQGAYMAAIAAQEADPGADPGAEPASPRPPVQPGL